MVLLRKYIVVILSFVFLFSCVNVNALEVSAKAAVLINGDNGEVIYAKNAHERMPMASTTKIMTGLLLCEYGNFDREITVTSEMLRVEGSSMGLLAGDRVTLHDLLYGLMLASGNDAANVIAFTIGGSLEGFAKKMNQKAKELGLKNTSFATPSGLDADDHYTTAYELAKITQYAMAIPEFAEAVATEKAVLNYGNPPYRRSLSNHNKLLKNYKDAVGVKTGFTKKSGRCLVSAAKRDGKFVIAVTLNAPDDWQDHTNLLDYGFSAIKQTEYSPLVNSYIIPVISGQTESIQVKIEPFTINSLETEDITCQVYLPKFVYAPIKNGDVLGNVVYKNKDTVLGEKTILANANIDVLENKKTPFQKVTDNFLYILKNI